MFSQVQLKYNGEDYFVADQVFVKYKTDLLGGKSIDDIIIIENKLSKDTELTTPQKNAFKRGEYFIRNKIEKKSEMGTGLELNSGDKLIFKNQIKWFKVYDGINGKTISGINKM